MFVKRMAQLKLLEEQYASPGSNIVIFYGRQGLGKTTLLTEFMVGKPAFYYLGLECADILQHLLMTKQWLGNPKDINAQDINSTDINPKDISSCDYSELFLAILEQEHKPVFILDEFHLIMKNSQGFKEALKEFTNPDFPIMLILCSSSIRWVENEMITSMGATSANITAYMKLKEFTFVELVNRFPKASVESCIYINAIVGGVPDYLNEWQESSSVRENMLSIFLNKDSRLFFEPQQFLNQELREPAVYNTILFALAGGNRKLNDIHERTGFSRAKISVYIKHLIQLDLVEKLVPMGEEGKENARKGLYRIKDNFFSFWYRFVFPNLSELMLGRAANVYDKWVEPYLDDYVEEYFSDVCTEYLKLMNQHQRLQGKYLWWDRWYGKNGTIDILAQGEGNSTLVGKCLWEERKLDISDYESLLSLSGEAGINPVFCYLFSKGGFTQELHQYGKNKKNIILVGLEDL